MNTATAVTLTLTPDQAWALRQMCADSACHWHHLWQDAMDGKRTDLDPSACSTLNSKAWEFYNLIGDLL